jgi:hypothetical protein
MHLLHAYLCALFGVYYAKNPAFENQGENVLVLVFDVKGFQVVPMMVNCPKCAVNAAWVDSYEHHNYFSFILFKNSSWMPL